jgi:hypothetical protein
MSEDRAEAQARLQVQSICEMVAALECDYDRLEELRGSRSEYQEADRTQPLTKSWAQAHPDDAQELAELEAAAGDCASREAAEQRIQDDALSVEVRSGWASMACEFEPHEFRIVLCTGGPHVELVGDLDEHNEPYRVRVKYADWGESGELFGFDHEPVLTYCRQFYFEGCTA